ncbi:MAG: hypothetical protein AAF789_02655 [Bacteroidota bacterium]
MDTQLEAYYMKQQESSIPGEDLVKKECLKEYCDNDPELLSIFIDHAKANLRELLEMIPGFRKEKDVINLKKLIHKVSPTIEIIGRQDLKVSLQLMKRKWENDQYYWDERYLLQEIEEIIASLEAIKQQETSFTSSY